MISINQQEKILEYYINTGQTDLAALQKKSIENSIKVVERRNAIQRNLNQNAPKKPLLRKIITKYPSCIFAVRVLTLATVVFVIVVINKGVPF